MHPTGLTAFAPHAIFDSMRGGPNGKLLFLLKYGRASGLDSDYLAIYDRQPPTSQVVLGGLDMFIASKENVEQQFSLMDPQVTEPILTGVLVFGEEEAFKEFKEVLGQVESSPKCFQHLLQSSFTSYLFAVDAYALLRDERDLMYQRLSASNLTFAITYRLLAQHHCGRSRKVKPISDLVAASPKRYRDVLEEARRLKRLREIATSQMKKALDSWELLLSHDNPV